ncbi:DUF3667 domain-containing protein [Flavobacterium selenitireducens]|uniref:DUF3667 domain-containing protein n=1 Tax=Flavobacterium selenitireducens TaxID=2722704 RepID=UPI00168A975E|nr:DUF3667 domain-containing protein [Flavobacterium selenitireducens]MBD3581377.1 DUF3667 domain-containing protein [Flavobacterium selenitireducens]
MSGHSPLRQDKTCLNCRHVVERRYCPNCGQENTDSRKTFHHLFIHFFEDLTHYENAFWKTIRHLLFKPGRLTAEYLSGKRLSYLAPVRLYIFISFVTFFVISLMPSDNENESHDTKGDKDAKSEQELLSLKFPENDTVPPKPTVPGKLTRVNGELVFVEDTATATPELSPEQLKLGAISMNVKDNDVEKPRKVKGFGSFSTVRELDSIQNTRPEGQKLSWFGYRLEKVLVMVRERSNEEDYMNDLGQEVVHNIPKALFLYMPIFAFWLWLFHGKKRWYYFDHGIFTLHYFSFMLLTLCVMMTVTACVSLAKSDVLNTIMVFAWIFLFGWWFFYFFRSHSRFYGESKAISRLKSLALYFINMWLISFFTLGLFAYTILNMH